MKTNTTFSLVSLGLLFINSLSAQTLTEKKGLRFYEHHSSDVTNAPFGNGADGSKSGYDFINHEFVWSFNENTFGPHTDGTDANIDMVEHGGIFGRGGNTFGFTAGVSSIWNGEIKGNGTTRWIKAPSTFAYSSATKVSDIKDLYNSLQGMDSLGIRSVVAGGVYLGRIRGGNKYVVMHCTSVKTIAGATSGNDNIYFDFEYKYDNSATGMNEELSQKFSLYPNPATSIMELSFDGIKEKISSVTITDLNGKAIEVTYVNNKIDVSTLSKGIYVISIVTASGETAQKRFIKA